MKERPIVVAVIGYIIGILMGLYFKFSIVPFYIPIGATYLLFKRYLLIKKEFKLISFHRYIKYVKIIINRKVIIILLISSFISNSIVLIQNEKYNNLYQNNQNLNVKAIIISDKQEKQYTNMYKIKIKNVGKFYLSINKNIKIDFRYGDEVYIKGKFVKPEIQRNEKGFNYKKYLKSVGIIGTINVSEVKKINSNKVNIIFIITNKISNKLKSTIDELLDKEEASILKGLLLGDTSYIDEELYEKFQISNMAHILAVSGMHVSYIIICINLLFKKIFGKRKTKYILIITLIFYMFITGFSPSIIRSSIMGILIIFSEIIYRKNDMWTSLSISLLIILAYNPFSINNIGFKLTYIGAISIATFNEDISIFLINRFKIKNSKLVNIISVTCSIQIGILPIVLYEFNYIGIYFLITNPIISIIIGPIVILGLVFLSLSTIYLPICRYFKFLVQLSIDLLVQISNISKFPFSKIYISTPKIWMILIYYIIIFSIKILYKVYSKKNNNLTEQRFKNIIALYRFKFNKNSKKNNYITKCETIIIILISIVIVIEFIPKQLEINFVDVSQGDCTFIVTPQNNTILIDGGGSESTNFDTGKRTLLPFILNKGYRKVDYVFISHFDQDHVRTDY